jgi:hypothetical protein
MQLNMNKGSTKYAVGMFMWRRNEHLPAILNAIIKYQPVALYLYVDGPRNSADLESINQVLTTCHNVLNSVSFLVHYSTTDEHMGLNKRFRSGLEHLFSIEAAAIILEDDTIPSASFFEFCTFYLSHYYYHKEVVAINGYFKTGTSFSLANQFNGPFTHHIFNPWGWASWAHKFQPLYKPDLQKVTWWQGIWVFSLWWNFDLYRLRRKLLRDIEIGVLNTWDVQLQWSIFLAHKKVLTSHINLISNVGNDSLASTFIAGSTDFNQPFGDLLVDTLPKQLPHLPQYDHALSRSKTNRVFILKWLRKIKDSYRSR